MNEKCDVILTYGWNRLTYNILRNLSQHGLKVVVGDESKYNMCSMSNLSYDTFQYPSPYLNPEEFIAKLLDMIEQYKPKVLIPCHEETFIIAKYIDRFPKDIKIPIADYDSLMKAHDKISANSIAEKVKVPIPYIYDIKSYDELETKKKSFVYPIVLKLSNSNAAKGVFYAHNYNELKQIYKENYSEENQLYIQEYVDGEGYGASFLYDQGKVITGFVHKRLIEKTYTGGVSVKRISVKNMMLYDYGKQILDSLNWNGPAMIEFKYNEELNRAWFIEINARYWGSLPLPIAAGLDIPFWHYQSAINEEMHVENYKENVTSTWILGSFMTLLERIVKRKLSFKKFKSILNFKSDNYDDLKKDDLKAFFGEIIYYLSRFLKSGSINPKIKGSGKF